MAGLVFTDRVQEVSTTGFGGTGAVQLNGVPASPAGRQTFVAGIGDANDCIYLIDDGAGNWEITVGTVTDASPDTLSRGTLISSSTGSRVNFSAGQKDIVVMPSSRMFPDIASGDVRKVLMVNSTEDGLVYAHPYVKGGDIASASPLVLDTDGDYFDVTGTTGFSAITVSAGRRIALQFDDAVPITVGSGITLNNAGSNYTTAAGDLLIGYAVATDTVVGFIVKADGLPMAGVIKQGKHTISVPATSMYKRTTNGAASGTAELGTNKVMQKTFDFDGTTQEFIQFAVPMPLSWDEGPITFDYGWTGAAGAGTVKFDLAGLALGDSDAMDAAFGTAVGVTDTFITADDLHKSAESAAVTIAGTPAAGDLVLFQLQRDPATDTKSEDAKIVFVRIFLTLDAADDS